MKEARILITGASGCVGQYISNWLLKNTEAKLILWIRDQNKLTAIDPNNPRIKLLIGDLREAEIFAKEISSATHLIHTATAWGDRERARQVNLIAVKKLLALLNPDLIQKIIYFSTASILDKQLIPIPEAINKGTEYIQTKAQCLQELEKHFFAEKIIAVFPTLVFGGNYDNSGLFPASYLTQGLKQAVNWLWLARWFKGYSKFHFMHAEDIAFVCCQLLVKTRYKHTQGSIPNKGITKIVLGQSYLSVDQAINSLLKWKGTRRFISIPLWGWLIEVMISVLPIQLSAWDRLSIRQRHFIHSTITRPEDFGGTSFAKSINEILMHSGFPRSKKCI